MPRAFHAAMLATIAIAAADLLLSALLGSTAGTRGSSFASQLARYVDADGEANFWAWYSSTLLAAIALALLVLAAQSHERAARRAALALSAIAAVMSLDEATVLHERLRYAVSAISPSGFAWLILGVPLAILVAVLAVRAASALSADLRRELIIAGTVYAAGAIGFELLGGVLEDGLAVAAGSPLLVLETTIEEALEFTGSLLALRAVAIRILPSNRSAEEAPCDARAAAPNR